MQRQQVWFSGDLVALHADLVAQGLTSQSFPDFCKTAFHDRVDDIRARRLKEEVTNGRLATKGSDVQP